jgi:mRNA-degrading endonuclease RelE of RelBE toxin-antitoxin system
MLKVLLGKKARNAFEELDAKTKKKVLEVLEALEFNPWPAKSFDLTKLEGLSDCFRIRVGSYRVCYHVNTEMKEITVYRIERRPETTYK